MKKLLAGLLTVLLFATAPVSAGPGYDCNDKDCANSQQTEKFDNHGNDIYVEEQTFANEATEKATLAMLYMVYTDLNNCLRSYNQNFKDSVSTVVTLITHSQPLKDGYSSDLPTIEEINKKNQQAKFYLVMNDRTAVVESLLENYQPPSEKANTGFNAGGYSDYPGNQNSIPVQTEIPVNQGGAINVSPIVPSVGGVVPVR